MLMIVPTMAVSAAIVVGSLSGPGAPHALGTTTVEPASSATVEAGVPDNDSNQCWRKKHNKHACIPLTGGGYASSPPGQPVTPTGGGYVSTPPGVAMPPVGGGYASTPPGEAIAPSGGGYVSAPPGQAIPPSG